MTQNAHNVGLQPDDTPKSTGPVKTFTVILTGGESHGIQRQSLAIPVTEFEWELLVPGADGRLYGFDVIMGEDSLTDSRRGVINLHCRGLARVLILSREAVDGTR